jgi:hypothetical protein
MRRVLLSTAFLAAAVPALAQSPQSVPLRENTPSRETTETRPPHRDPLPDGTGSVAHDTVARQRPNANVPPPAAIDSSVKIIAPERK